MVVHKTTNTPDNHQQQNQKIRLARPTLQRQLPQTPRQTMERIQRKKKRRSRQRNRLDDSKRSSKKSEQINSNNIQLDERRQTRRPKNQWNMEYSIPRLQRINKSKLNPLYFVVLTNLSNIKSTHIDSSEKQTPPPPNKTKIINS